MSIIYEPTGKAREYSPLAVNLYSGCGHKCKYCYVPNILRVDRNNFDSTISERNNVISQLAKEAKQIRNSEKQVMMSFTTDPYNPFNDKQKLTRKALNIFLDNLIPVAILSKAGKRILQDLDTFKLFGEQIKVGASLTYYDEEDSLRVESGAAIPKERIETLMILHQNNIKTWASFEPIVDLSQTYKLVCDSIDFVDEYQFGKLANDKRPLDWNGFLTEITNLLRSRNKLFYIKQTLRESTPKVILQPHEREMDFLTLKPFPKIKNNLFE